MDPLEPDTLLDLLRRQGRLPPGRTTARVLSGGVSNAVFLVASDTGERLVVKQARDKLNVEADWRASVERIWREVDVLRVCGKLLEEGVLAGPGASPAGAIMAHYAPSVPQVLWEDREHYLYAMTAAPEGHGTWKQMLLAGETRAGIGLAVACGLLLGTLHSRSCLDASLAARLGDRTFFDELRLDPYYRFAAVREPKAAPALDALVAEASSLSLSLVHGDFSPKNLLVWPGHVMLIDFEVGHFGDPAFDLGFFLTHLVLKATRDPVKRSDYLRLGTLFWNTYRYRLGSFVPPTDMDALAARAMRHLAGCMLARVRGKSPVEYLSASDQTAIHSMALAWLSDPPPNWDEACARLTA